MTNNSTQLSAATALVQLLQEQERLGLPRLAWRISDREPLADRLYGSGPSAVDPRPVIAAWAEALGSEVLKTPFDYDGEPRVEFAVRTVWRDVRVEICMSYPALLLAETAVAA